MTILKNTVLATATLASVMGLAACQSTSMNDHHMRDTDHHGHMWGEHKHHENQETLSDGQILAVLSTANSGEIMQANTALPKLQSAQVRSYAQNMINAHTANEQKGQMLGNRLQLIPQASNTSNALQMDSNEIVTKLSNTASAADRDYIRSQVKVHHKVLKTIDNQLLPNAKNPELHNMLVETRAAVAMHLQMAEQLDAMMK